MTKRMPQIVPLRVYDLPDDEPGYRLLVDRLWPRGLSKEKLHLDEWVKQLAPSTELRQWFGHRPEVWDEFQQRYLAELQPHMDEVDRLAQLATHRRLLLLYAARDTEHCHAVVLQQLLERRRTKLAE